MSVLHHFTFAIRTLDYIAEHHYFISTPSASRFRKEEMHRKCKHHLTNDDILIGIEATEQTPNSVKGDRNNNCNNAMPPEGYPPPGGSFHIQEELNMIYVMSDIHGREDRFNAILAQIHLKRTDHLYILGDVIDRNPDGIRLLRRIAQSKNMSMLLGNHEYMMLDAIDHPESKGKMQLWLWFNGGDITWNKWKYCNKKFQSEMLSYLRSLPINIEVSCAGKDWLLVHGGPEETIRMGCDGIEEDLIRKAVWQRISITDLLPNGKVVVFGHTPTMHYQQNNPMEIFYGDNRIGIDCGCAYENGRLACLRLDDGAVFYSEGESHCHPRQRWR